MNLYHIILQHPPVFFCGGPTTSFVPAENFFTFELLLLVDRVPLLCEWVEGEGSTLMTSSLFWCWCFEELFDGDFGCVGAFDLDFLEELFLLFRLLDVFKRVEGTSPAAAAGTEVSLELFVISTPLPQLLFLGCLPLLDGELSSCLFGLCCLTLDMERCFLRSARVCDCGGDVWEGLLLFICCCCWAPAGGENEFWLCNLPSWDAFSDGEDEVIVSWLVILTVMWLFLDGDELFDDPLIWALLWTSEKS